MRRLGRWLRAKGRRVEWTREPDGTRLGVAVRRLFEHPGVRPEPLVEVFLFMAARHQHVAEKIRPWLERGRVVLCDRYADATVAYQGYGRGVDPNLIRELNVRATGGVLPDLTLLFDLDPVEGFRRIRGRRRDRFEREALAFHRRVRRGYPGVRRAEPQRRRPGPAAAPRGPGAAGGRAIRIDAIRELERQAALRPVMARRKLFVLDEAERMTGEAPQAFLKTLEEPPVGTVMILVLPRARALPATVVSRCQVVRFEPRSDQAEAALRAQAQALLAEVRAEGAEVMFRRTERLDRETAEGLVDAYWLFCRDLVLAKAGAPASLLADAGRVTELAREAETWTLDDLLGAIELCRQAREALLRNVAPRLTIEVILSRLALRAA